MVSRIKETTTTEEKWVPAHYETVTTKKLVAGRYTLEDVEGVPSIIFEGDDVGHLLYVLYMMERGIYSADGKINVFVGRYLDRRIRKVIGYKRAKSLVLDFVERTGVRKPSSL